MAQPRGVSTGEPVPHGHTARRLEWSVLPPSVRALVERHLRSEVTAAESAGAGFTPGFASVLTCANGSRVFVKAASKVAQAPFAQAYREEIRKLQAMPVGLPASRLLWSHEDDGWVVLGLEYVPGANPTRPWRSDQLDACLDSLETIAPGLTPPPMPLATFAEEFADCVAGWQHLRERAPHWAHLDEAEALARRYVEVTAGDTLVHTDARDDNFLISPTGAVLCDWNWPVVGAAWIDTVLLLIAPHGDGIDTDGVLVRRHLTKKVAPESVDVLLALVCGYFMKVRDDPVPSSSPYIRLHQSWYAEATWAWLAARRGWT